MKRLLAGALVSGLAVTTGPLLAVGAADAAPVAASVPIGTSEGTYIATTPTRLLDTRTGGGQIAPGQSATVPVLGKAGVPSSGVSAVVVNLTATRASSSGYLTAYASGSSAGGTSNVVFAKGETRASLVTVPVGADGSIKVLDGAGTGAGPVDAVVDVQGYYLSSSADPEQYGTSFDLATPQRVLDTREDQAGAVKPGGTVTVTLGSDGDEEGTGAQALAVNITAASPTAPGFLTAWDGTGTRPTTSNVNFARGQATPNNAVVPLTLNENDDTSSFSVYNGSAGSTQVVVDVYGAYYDGPFGERFVPLDTPVRIVNSTTGRGTGKLGEGMAATVQAPASVLSTPSDDSEDGGATGALVGTLTAVRPTMATYLSAYATGQTRPLVSNLNPAKGQSVANHAVIGLSDDSKFDLFNFKGSTDVVVDVTGRFEEPTLDSGTAASRSQAAKAERLSSQRDGARFSVEKVTRS